MWKPNIFEGGFKCVFIIKIWHLFINGAHGIYLSPHFYSCAVFFTSNCHREAKKGATKWDSLSSLPLALYLRNQMHINGESCLGQLMRSQLIPFTVRSIADHSRWDQRIHKKLISCYLTPRKVNCVGGGGKHTNQPTRLTIGPPLSLSLSVGLDLDLCSSHHMIHQKFHYKMCLFRGERLSCMCKSTETSYPF